MEGEAMKALVAGWWRSTKVVAQTLAWVVIGSVGLALALLVAEKEEPTWPPPDHPDHPPEK